MTRRGPRRLRVTIDELSGEGLGVGRFEDRVVHSRNGLPGETVTVTVRRRRGGVWYGEGDDPDPAVPARRHPPCSAFPRCGGCVLMHLDYPRQLEAKAGWLRAELERHGLTAARIRAPVSVVQLHYRYRARLGVRVVDGEVLIGFREGFGNRIARTRECRTLAAGFVQRLPALAGALASLRRPDRVPQIEFAGGDRDVAILVRHLTALDEREHRVLLDFARLTDTRVYLQPGGYDTVWRLDSGGNGAGAPPSDPHLTYSLADFGLCYRFLPTDFIQVNPFVNRALVRAALLGLAPRPGARVTDLFCGIGNFSLALARSGLRVFGYESSPAAVARARLNAQVNGLEDRAEFVVMDLYDARCPSLPESEYLLLDPPRSGAGENLQRWAACPRLERIAYVSCNPRSFATDAALLRDRGFDLEEVGIFDMFPHTAHVETLGIFSRNGSCARGTARG
jgi:23S rRNA (uracil1939-C5)-methyltransferase